MSESGEMKLRGGQAGAYLAELAYPVAAGRPPATPTFLDAQLSLQRALQNASLALADAAATQRRLEREVAMLYLEHGYCADPRLAGLRAVGVHEVIGGDGDDDPASWSRLVVRELTHAEVAAVLEEGRRKRRERGG